MKYLVRLKPLKPYFFGSENSFSKDDIRDESRYFAKSLLFPQQTTIIGMLRKELLRATNCLSIHKKGEWVDKEQYHKAVEYTGKGDVFAGNLGIINSISEVFLLNEDEFIFKAENDRELNPKKTDIKVSLNGFIRDFIDFGINPKNYENNLYISNKNSYKFDDIFKRYTSVGIQKNKDQEAFYQKEAYFLKDNFEFGFILELSKEIKNIDTILELGGDGSLFSVEFCDYKEIEYPFEIKELDRIVILSDTILPKDIMEDCEYIFGDSYLIRSVKRGSKKTKREKVLTRGSVIYPKDIEKVSQKLKNNKNLNKIGMNQFKELKNV